VSVDADDRTDDHDGHDDGNDYRAVNLANWESRVEVHAASDDYGLQRFRDDPTHLSSVVEYDLPRLGDVAGLDVVHLQCHIGTDTISLARLGARTTGLDFSAGAIDVARELAASAGPDVEYVVADVYDAVGALGGGRFDLVYTGIGALCWLPSVDRWAAVIANLLRDGGELFMREGHPVMWTLDEQRPDGLLAIEYPYFETAGIPFSETETYVDHDAPLASPDTVSFNHGLAEIFNALWSNGFEITLFEEHDTVPWTALGDQMADRGDGEFQLVDRPERFPHSYTVRARLQRRFVAGA
jgi:SAM-dependent methyltransferase